VFINQNVQCKYKNVSVVKIFGMNFVKLQVEQNNFKGEKKMNRVEKNMRLVIDAALILGVVALVAMCGLTVSDVFLRFIFNDPIIGCAELIEILMACVVFLGLGKVALSNGHVVIDIIDKIVSKKTMALLDSINNFVVMGLCLLLIRQTAVQGFFLQNMGRASTMLKIPLHPFHYLGAVSFFLLFAAVAILQYNQYITKKE
jgi:TRAP-type C4-dicarboxylate transport system permease small subunit